MAPTDPKWAPGSVPHWYSNPDFWIPQGTEYAEEEIHHKDPDLRTSRYNSRVSGYHYQLEPKYRMAVVDDLSAAAHELEREYDKAAQTVLNLPPYDELVGR